MEVSVDAHDRMRKPDEEQRFGRATKDSRARGVSVRRLRRRTYARRSGAMA